MLKSSGSSQGVWRLCRVLRSSAGRVRCGALLLRPVAGGSGEDHVGVAVEGGLAGVLDDPDNEADADHLHGDVVIDAEDGARQRDEHCEALREQYQGRKIMAVDSLCASMGEGLFVHVVLKYRDEGHDIDACRDYAENIRQSIMHWFTVEDLVYLKRGGRISAASYFAATVLNIKPVLNVDPKGHLVSRNKVQGRKRSLRALYENVVKYADHPERQTMFIGHGDCLEDAEWLAKRLKEELHVPEIMIGYIGPVIGAHSGPGTLAVFFVDPTGAGRLEAE